MIAKPNTQVNDTEVNRYTLEGGTLTAREAFELEGPGEDTLDSIVRLHLDTRQRKLFACDCAERALLRARLLGYEPDPRSWAAVEVSRQYAEGKGSIPELKAAIKASCQAADIACSRVVSASVLEVVGRVTASWAARTASRSAYYTGDITSEQIAALFNAQDASKACREASFNPGAELLWQIERALWYAEGERPTP